MASRSCLYAFLLLLAFQSTRVKGTIVLPPPQCRQVPATSSQLIQFALNLIFLETELNLRASTGRGIDDIAPGLVQGPAPIGARLANLDSVTLRFIEEFGLQGIGHIRAILETGLVAPIRRPQLNISVQLFSSLFSLALNVSSLSPPFDPYANTINYLFVAASTSSLLQQYYAGIIPSLIGNELQQLVAGLSNIEAARFGVIRAQLYARANVTVSPYRFTVENLTDRIALTRTRLGGCGVKDEGLIVPLQLGAENRTTSNIIPADVNSLAFSRTAREILRLVFATGNATRPGGFFPLGANGIIAQNIIRLRLS